MKPSSVAGEAWRNITSGTTRAGILSVFWTIIVGSLIILEFVSVAAIVTSAAQFRAAGGNVAVMVAVGRIDGEACARMASLPNVHAAGALRAAPVDLLPDNAPGAAVVTKEVTPGLISLLIPGASASTSGLYVSSDVSAGLGVVGGDILSVDGLEAHISGTFAYPADGRRAGLGYSIVEPVTSTGLFDECWVQIWPQSDEVLSLMSTTVTDAGSGEPPVLAQLNPTLGSTFPGSQLYRDRLTSYSPIVAGALGVLVSVGSIMLRRLEFASARHLGVTRSAQFAQLMLETSAWAATGSVIATVVAVGLGLQLEAPDRVAYVAAGALTIGAGLLGALAGVLVGTAWVDERQFLRYFRER